MIRVFRILLPCLLAVVALAQQSAGPRVLKVGGNVQAGNLVKKVSPQYPAAMKAMGREATVSLAVLISTEGVPVSMSVEDTNGPSDFTDAAIEAVKQWRYKPTIMNGAPVDVMTTVQVNFTLAK